MKMGTATPVVQTTAKAAGWISAHAAMTTTHALPQSGAPDLPSGSTMLPNKSSPRIGRAIALPDPIRGSLRDD
jgi:hypothetical protein